MENEKSRSLRFKPPWERVDVPASDYFAAVASPECTREDIVSQCRAVAHSRGWEVK